MYSVVYVLKIRRKKYTCKAVTMTVRPTQSTKLNFQYFSLKGDNLFLVGLKKFIVGDC